MTTYPFHGHPCVSEAGIWLRTLSLDRIVHLFICIKFARSLGSCGGGMATDFVPGPGWILFTLGLRRDCARGHVIYTADASGFSADAPKVYTTPCGTTL